MPPYSGPSKERSEYSSNFVRVGDEVYVTNPADVITSHDTLAKGDGILEQVKCQRLVGPATVDAGLFTVNPYGNGMRIIRVFGKSITLDLPVIKFSDLARKQTGVVFQNQSPDHIVVITDEELRAAMSAKLDEKYKQTK